MQCDIQNNHKTIANRLKPMLPNLVDETQSAFVQNKQITNKALIVFEIFHFLKKKTTRRKGFMALKVNMAKAYDRIEWPFLEYIQKNMSFLLYLTKLIMRYVTPSKLQLTLQKVMCCVICRNIIDFVEDKEHMLLFVALFLSSRIRACHIASPFLSKFSKTQP